MSVLAVFFCPDDTTLDVSPHNYDSAGIKIASLSLANDLEEQDIYAIARKLAELLLEQLR